MDSIIVACYKSKSRVINCNDLSVAADAFL